MNLIFESTFVGIYTIFIYLIFSVFIKNFYLLLLVCGFFKHFLGSSFGLWTWYCNNGQACLKVLSRDQYYEANTLNLIRESLYESVLFLIFGLILSLIVSKGALLFFILGFSLHIISEKTGIHKKFCRSTCDKIN